MYLSMNTWIISDFSLLQAMLHIRISNPRSYTWNSKAFGVFHLLTVVFLSLHLWSPVIITVAAEDRIYWMVMEDSGIKITTVRILHALWVGSIFPKEAPCPRPFHPCSPPTSLPLKWWGAGASFHMAPVSSLNQQYRQGHQSWRL